MRPSPAHAALAACAGAAALIATTLMRPAASGRVIEAAGKSFAIAAQVAAGRPGHLAWNGSGAERERGGPAPCGWCRRIFWYRGPGAVVCSGPCGDQLARLALSHPDRVDDPAFVAAWRELVDVEQAAGL